MSQEISIRIAELLGPILIVVSSSEFLNFKIWQQVDVKIVSLNGLLLFAGGIAIVRYHNIWIIGWPLIITILGWLIMAGGIFRLYFPAHRQLNKGRSIDFFLFILFIIGIFLTIKAYFI